MVVDAVVVVMEAGEADPVEVSGGVLWIVRKSSDQSSSSFLRNFNLHPCN